MTGYSYRNLTFVVLILLILGTAGVALGGEESGEEKTLTGCATEVEGGYVLVEQESGDEIALTGSEAVGNHLGHTVELTGHWSEDGEGNDVFEVSSVKHISASCE